MKINLKFLNRKTTKASKSDKIFFSFFFMLQKSVILDRLIDAVGSSDLLIHAASVKLGGLTLSSITTKANTVLLVAQSKDLPSKIVCKINVSQNKVLFTRLSPDLSQVALFLDNSTISIISTTQFLNFVSPATISGFQNNPMFPHESLGFSLQETKQQLPQRFSQPFKFQFLDAFWWVVGKKKFLVIIDQFSINVVSIHSFTHLKSISINDIFSYTYTTSEKYGTNKAYIAIFTKQNTQIITLECEGNDIIQTITPQTILLNQQQQIMAQFSKSSDSKWFLSILSERLTFYDNNMSMIPISSFDSNSSKTNAYAVTKDFIFHSTDHVCYVQFIKSIDVNKMELMHDVTQIIVIDAENDEVLLISPSKATLFSLADSPVSLFTNFLKKHHYRDAFALCDGFSLDTKSLCEQTATKCIKSGDFDSALEVLNEGQCEIRPSLQRLISEGIDRHALHLLLRSGSQLPPAKINKIFELLLKKISLKNQSFTRICLQLKQYSKENENFFYPSSLSYDLIEKLKQDEDIPNYPKSLLFKFQVKNRIESTKYLKYASSIDINSQLPLTYSSEFIALLHAIDKNDGCIELKIPNCSKLRFIKFNDIYVPIFLHENQLFFDMQCISLDFIPMNFEIFNNKIYVIDSNFKVYVSSINSIDFYDIDIPHSIMIETDNTTKIVFITVSGGLAIIDSREFVELIEGQFVDATITRNGTIYALNDEGYVLEISKKQRKIFFDQSFVTSICSSNEFLAFHSSITNTIYFQSNKYPNNNFLSYELPFNVVFSKSSDNKAIFVGEGKIALLTNNDSLLENENQKASDFIKIIDYPYRTGSILDVTSTDKDDGVILIGSSSPPMKVFSNVNNENNDIMPVFEEAKIIVEKYPHDLVIPLVRGKVKTLLLILYGFANEIGDKSHDLLAIIPYFNQIGETYVSDAIHAIVQSKCTIPDELLFDKSARKAFLKYPSDLQFLSKTQLLKLLPQKSTFFSKSHKSLDSKELGIKILKGETTSTIIQPSQIHEESIACFSCSHVLSKSQMDASISSLKDYCSQSKLINTFSFIEKDYSLKQMSLPCPKCLLRQLTSKPKN